MTKTDMCIGKSAFRKDDERVKREGRISSLLASKTGRAGWQWVKYGIIFCIWCLGTAERACALSLDPRDMATASAMRRRMGYEAGFTLTLGFVNRGGSVRDGKTSHSSPICYFVHRSPSQSSMEGRNALERYMAIRSRSPLKADRERSMRQNRCLKAIHQEDSRSGVARRDERRVRKLKISGSVSDTSLDKISRTKFSNISAPTTTTYQSLVAIKEAIDVAAGWKTPDLSGTQLVRRQRQKNWDLTGEPFRRVTSNEIRKKNLDPIKDLNVTGSSWVKSPNLASRNSFSRELVESSSEESSTEINHVLDIQRTLLNCGLFVSTIAGWKDQNGLSWYTSVGIGICMYIFRYKVDDILDTHDVHSEDWFELFSRLPEPSFKSIAEYGKIYLSSALVFVSSLFIWRGIWAGIDDTQISWQVCLVIGTISYMLLSVMQLQLERRRFDEGDTGSRSTSLFTERHGIMGRVDFFPEGPVLVADHSPITPLS
ncbi:hypothetical protein GUITHDRAFT_105818 [Guillardia theta CCMP2712]|uniref:Uncharacterized protein n=1 Tax=Guillardia theta (strain CCMP2712) TaxID=905079 RepID=L1JI81_GUITC|nr:hypothetical protein GUITHDRAFT_105818 [Guillardia theta CCMP2712]EKX48211.1 hypothetical protein GUITHDRAFT_105818 [Guillardia theta CCMP2712]|eukprot:XP_005835191.1 hypothetical protein GUITHDRAFT_105818 [Guillardia theta CCMP2712]